MPAYKILGYIAAALIAGFAYWAGWPWAGIIAALGIGIAIGFRWGAGHDIDEDY